MVAVGEQTGELEKMLSKISDYYEQQANESLSGLTSIIEPVVISLLGISIGFMVMAMLLPVFSVIKSITK
jgi:type IV pilus assembly protein PilC